MIEPLEVGINKVSDCDLLRFAVDLEREGVGWEGVREAEGTVAFVFKVACNCACPILAFTSLVFNINHSIWFARIAIYSNCFTWGVVKWNCFSAMTSLV
jgi:hypothetical protein